MRSRRKIKSQSKFNTCFVCMNQQKSTFDILGAKGVKMNVKEILSLHFWFQVRNLFYRCLSICMLKKEL